MDQISANLIRFGQNQKLASQEHSISYEYALHTHYNEKLILV